MQTLYQVIKTLHIFGFITAIGITIANLIAYQQFWKLYLRDREQGISAFKIVQKLQVAGMAGMAVLLLAGITLLALIHGSFITLLWFQIKLGFVVLLFLNGLTLGRTSAMSLQTLMKQESPASDVAVHSVQHRTRVFFTIQLILFSSIVVLSIFRFSGS